MSDTPHRRRHRRGQPVGAASPAAAATAEVPEAAKIVLAGNPNAGKSVIFHGLCGVYVEVSNYPGTTIEMTAAPFCAGRLVDSPGVYGLGSFNDEERVARDTILAADVIVNVVDAVHLERDLFLTLQLLELEKPTVVALNMMDEAATKGVRIDIPRLQHRLGVPVVPTVAVRGEGIAPLKQALCRPGWASATRPGGWCWTNWASRSARAARPC